MAAPAVAPTTFEFRFIWDAREHRRLFRALQREALGRSKFRYVIYVWAAVMCLLAVSGMAHAATGVDRVEQATPLLIVGLSIGLYRWALPRIETRSYRRRHALCLPNAQVVTVTPDAIEARCTTTTTKLTWSGVVRIIETPEFFLFFSTPACALHIPKRVIGDVAAFRQWLLTHHRERVV